MSKVLIGRTFFVLFILILGFYLVSKNPLKETKIVQNNTKNEEAQRKPPAGQREYHNSQYKFSLFYPRNLKITENFEPGGAITVTFEDLIKLNGFQIFIVPYSEPLISEERFRMDEPSLVRKNVSEIKIDGVSAVKFDSQDLILGNTTEVWFIKNGYLYEITTLKSLESELQKIIKTFIFVGN